VPQGTKQAYKSAQVWKNFNIIEKKSAQNESTTTKVNPANNNTTPPPVPTSYTIKTSPSTGGKTSGNGTYTSGTSCTVRATADKDYTFVNWTENSRVVSTSPNYTFTVSTNRTLVANFTPPDYTALMNSALSEAENAFNNGNHAAAYNAYIKAAEYADANRTNGWTYTGGSGIMKTSYEIKQNAAEKFKTKADKIINRNGGCDHISKELLQYANKLNSTWEIQNLLNKCN